MTGILITCCVVVGLAIGSFLNVVIWRVPRGESVVSPASACPRCETAIRARDNVPVLGWLLLRGRCRDCGEPISPRYPLVEAATGLAFGAVAAWVGSSPGRSWWELPAFLYLVAISIALALIDIDVKRLPNVVVLPSYLVGAALLTLPVLVGSVPAWSLARAGLGMLALGLFYFATWFAYPKGMGFGDVKFAGVLGLYLGYLGWRELICGAVLAFLIGGLVSIALMLAGGRKVKIPFGPYMLAGAWLGVVAGVPLADLYLRVAGLT